MKVENKINYEKFENFIHAFGATKLLLQKAYENGSLLEGLVLYASIIDGFCRIALILKEQIKKKTDEIDTSYIYQGSGHNYYSERKIYEFAHKNEIIDDGLYREINTLYDIRNKAIHRFFISEIEYSHLEVVLNRFERVYQKLYETVYALESEQIQKGVGITKLGRYTEADKYEIKKDICRKIKSGSERNLAKTLGCTSVEEVIEFASQKGLFQKCKVCNHLKIEHFNIDVFKKKGSKNGDLDNYLSACRSRGCVCEKYKNGNSH